MLRCDIEGRTFAGRGLRAGDRDVLFEHEPALVARSASRRRTTSSIRASPLPERPEQAGLGGGTSDRVAVADVLREARVDVLEVDVADAVGVVPDERGRVDAADQQVAAVEAPRHVGVRERLLDLARRSRRACRRAGAGRARGPPPRRGRPSSRRCSPARFHPSASRVGGADQSRSATSAATNTSAPAAASWPRPPGRARACRRARPRGRRPARTRRRAAARGGRARRGPARRRAAASPADPARWP